MNRPHPEAKYWSSRPRPRGYCGAPRAAHVGEQQRCPDAHKPHHTFRSHGNIRGRASTSMREEDALVLAEVVRRLLRGEDLHQRFVRQNAAALGRLARAAGSMTERIAAQRAKAEAGGEREAAE